jgi:hypothetical protein
MSASPVKDVGEILESTGFHLMDTHSFDAAYVRFGRLTSLVFLITDLSDRQVDSEDIDVLISNARAWCKKHVNATSIFNEAGLNLVLLHQGQISRRMVIGLCDPVGNNAAILQSVTAIDMQRRSVAQAKTWIVLGRVRRALRRLARDQTVLTSGGAKGTSYPSDPRSPEDLRANWERRPAGLRRDARWVFSS